MLNGIDVYEGNDIESWQQVKDNNVQVVIQKATQGTGHVDSLLYYRIPKIKQAGLNIGYYHFAQYNSTNPIGEAQHFLSTIKNQPLDTVLWVDVEIDDKWNKQTAINYSNQFINYVQNQGYKIGLYTGESFYNSYLKGNIPNIPLWIAKYSSNPPATYPTHSWQYSETGKVAGIASYSDMDYFNENILLSNNTSSTSSNIIMSNQLAEKYRYKEENVVGDKWIAMVQSSLNEIKIFDDENKPLLCDGVEGDRTKESYKRFQEVIDVPRTSTWTSECNTALTYLSRWYKWMNDNNRWSFNGK